MSGAAVKLLIREAAIGTGLAITGGIFYKVAFAAPTTRTYKTYYKNLEKAEAEKGVSSSPENAEILEKVEKVIQQLEGGGEAAEEASEE